MNALRQLQNFCIPWATTMALACFGNASAQVSYKVTDLGVLHNWNQGCAMGVNNHGWTEGMDGILDPSGQLAAGRAVLKVDGVKIDLGTLGGPNSWTNYNGINDPGDAAGYAETSDPDPNGEDICFFGTHLTCRPFIWHDGHMKALPTLGGNNGQASAINNKRQVVGYAENGMPDTTCPANVTNNRIVLGVLWDKGKAHALPTVGNDPDGVAFGINNEGRAAGYSGTCTAANHAISWENGVATPLPDLGVAGSSVGIAINDHGQIVGQVASPDGTTYYAALWQNGTITNLGTLPGDFTAFAEGINNKGQVVGSTQNSSFQFAHAFIWQNGVMTDLNTLFPASSNLYATMANSINERGQISGMATVMSGPDKGDVHEFLATPISGGTGPTVADIAPVAPKTNLPALSSKQLLRNFGPGQLGR